MNKLSKLKEIFICFIILGFFSISLSANENNAIDKINNFIKYSDIFYSSGQPTEEQLERLSKDNFKRIIYLAFTGNKTAIAEEDKIVKELKMNYFHIPVDFKNPTLSDFESFAAVMNASPESKTLLHCQINLRASAFSFLYRVIYKKVPMNKAKSDMDTIWEANQIWFKFIRTVLKKYGFNQNCDECDWGANEFNNV